MIRQIRQLIEQLTGSPGWWPLGAVVVFAVLYGVLITAAGVWVGRWIASTGLQDAPDAQDGED